MITKIWTPLVLIILLFGFSSAPGFAQNKSLHLESMILESFEDDPDTGETLLQRWIVRPSKFVKKMVDLNDNKEKADLQVAKVNIWGSRVHSQLHSQWPPLRSRLAELSEQFAFG